MCTEAPYISEATTPDAIFDQLSPQEYMATAAWMVRPARMRDEGLWVRVWDACEKQTELLRVADTTS